jgi:hypothetical protein
MGEATECNDVFGAGTLKVGAFLPNIRALSVLAGLVVGRG